MQGCCDNPEYHKLDDTMICISCLHSFKEEKEKETNICCSSRMVIIDSFVTCMQCGNAYETLVYENEFDKPSSCLSLYKRMKFFDEHIGYLEGIKQSDSPQMNKALDQLKNVKINDISELNRFLRKNKFNKLYKHVYNIYNTIKQTRIICFTNLQKSLLRKEFRKMEHRFKQKFKQKKNFFSYNVIIQCIMKKHGMEGHQHIILPKNYKKICTAVFSLLE